MAAGSERQAAPAAPPQDKAGPLGMIVARLAEVLCDAHAAGREIEECYGDLIRGAPRGTLSQVRAAAHAAGHPGPGASLQELDRLVQVLDNLSRFLAALAPEIPAGLQIATGPARAELSLRDLETMLLSQPGRDGPDLRPFAAQAQSAEVEDGVHLL